MDARVISAFTRVFRRAMPGHDLRRTTAAGARLGPLRPKALEPPAHRLVRNARAWPAVEPAMHEPDHQKTEYAGEHHVGEEMRAGRHAQHAHGGAEGERAAIGERAPLRRHHRGARHRPERARRLAGGEGANLPAIGTRIPTRTETIGP